MNNKVYIAGPITGVENWEARFFSAELKVMSMEFFDRHGNQRLVDRYGYFGFDYVSPRMFPIDNLRRWAQMAYCLWHLSWCSYVYMMDGWKGSKGARQEHRWAKMLRKRIIYYNE